MSGPVDRFGQLTYTSFDAGGIGGWQVKDHRGLSEDEQDVLRARIDPRLDPGTELPRFPAPDEVARLPRRLVFARERLPTGAASAWWHHAPAGVDGSGRPGNVFTHVLVDRAPPGSDPPSSDPPSSHPPSSDPPGSDPPSPHPPSSDPPGSDPVTVDPAGGGADWWWRRPIEWWRSPTWLAPYGPEAVRDCHLTREIPAPAEQVGIGAVSHFLLDVEHYRLGVLSVLLDAVAAALAGGPRVVLATGTTDRAAVWISAVSHLMAGVTAQRFGFSTLERSPTVAGRFGHDVHLCCVPLVDHDELAQQPGRGFVLLAEDEAVGLGDLDGHPHTTLAGDRVAVTEWSVLARVVLIDPHTAQRALTELDSLAEQARAADEPDALTGEPAWPLAMLVSTRLHVFGDAAHEASRVLVRRSPRGLSAVARLRDSVRGMVRVTQGNTAAELWQSLQRIARPGQPLSETGEQLLGVYVAHAVQDADWLAQRPAGAPLPTASWSTRWAALPEVMEAVDGGIDRFALASAHDLRAAQALVGLTDLLVRLDLVGEQRADRLHDALDRGVARAMTAAADEPPLGISGTHLVALLPSVAEPTAELLRAAVNGVINEARAHGHGAVGRRVSAEVARWLYPRLPPPVLPQSGEPVEDLLLRAELAYHLAVADPRRFARERPLALMTGWLDGIATNADRLLYGAAWTVDELQVVELSFPGHLPLEVFAPAAKTEPLDGAFDQLVDVVSQHRRTSGLIAGGLAETPSAAHLLRLRRLTSQGWWQSQQWFRHHLMDVLRGGLWAEQLDDVAYEDDVADVLRAACVLAAASGVGRAEAERLITGGLGDTTLGRRAWAIVSEGVPRNVPLPDVCLAGVLSDPRFPVPSVVSALHRWVGGVQVVTLTERMPVLQACARSEAGLTGAEVDRLAPVVQADLAEVLIRSGEPERAQRAAERFAQSWLRSLAPRAGVFQRLWGDR